MEDLKEHFGLILSILGGLLTVVGVLITVIWNDMRKSMNTIKSDAAEFSTWLSATAEAGGVVTRDLHFDFCGKEREKCPVRGLLCWKEELYGRGGPMTATDSRDASSQMTASLTAMFMSEIKHNRDLLTTELQLIQATLKNEVLTGIAKMRDEIIQQLKNGR